MKKAMALIGVSLGVRTNFINGFQEIGVAKTNSENIIAVQADVVVHVLQVR
ncbi:MAG: hypothetical protein ACLS9T_08200 [Streptococcus salivarius]